MCFFAADDCGVAVSVKAYIRSAMLVTQRQAARPIGRITMSHCSSSASALMDPWSSSHSRAGDLWLP